MKNCILATDLALFFPNKARLANIVKKNVFDWEHPDHRWVILIAIIQVFSFFSNNVGDGSLYDWK